MRRVDMAAHHRNGNASRHKTKRAEPQPRPSQKMFRKQLLHALCRCCHVDAGQLEGLALYRALNGHVMAGMRRHLVLRIDNVHFLVGVVHEHVLGAMLLDALGRALALAFFRALGSALAIRNPAGPGAIGRHRECSREQRCCHCYCKSYFHDLPLQKSTAVLDPPGRPVAWHSGGMVSRLFLRPNTRDSYSRMSVNKKGRILSNPPYLAVLPRS